MKIRLLFVSGILASITAWTETHYVATNGPSMPPYTSWATAGSNIIDVVNCAMTNNALRTIWVSNGTYYLTNQVVVTNSLTLQSVNGRDVTIVDGHNYPGKPVTNRCFYMSDQDAAVLDGFTISNGYAGDGGAIYGGGTTRNCSITLNMSTNRGGGVYLGILITNCIISRNFAGARGGGIYNSLKIVGCVIGENGTGSGGGGSGGGGGAFLPGGNFMQKCIVISNWGTVQSGYGGALYLRDATVRNCMIAYNTNVYYGGLYVRGGYIENCTIVHNRGNDVGGIAMINNQYVNTPISNSIVMFNTPINYCQGTHTTGIFYNCCITSMPDIATNCITDNPLFVSTNDANYRLSKFSPCVNAGANEAWMLDAFDLGGYSRVDRFSGVVDMGCYEYLPQGMMFSVP